jgi:hypothetical protein
MMPKRKAEKTVTGKVKCNKRLKPVSWELNPKLESCLEEFRSCWDKNEALLYPTGGNITILCCCLIILIYLLSNLNDKHN